MFVQIESTPNPNSLKFLPGKVVSNNGSFEVTKKEESNNELIKSLLSIKGVEGIFLGKDFISINKLDSISWEEIKHIVISLINDFYLDGKEFVIDKNLDENTEDLENLSAGTYNLTVQDINNCTASITVEITAPEPLSISENHSDYFGYGVTCNGESDGWIDVTTTGGAGEITYSWDSGENTEDLDNLSAGSYTITATDENNISVSTTVIITESDVLTLSEEHSDYNGYGVECYGDENGFIDISVRLRKGRDLETRKKATQHIFDTAQNFLNPILEKTPFALSMEMRNIDPELSPKINSIPNL